MDKLKGNSADDLPICKSPKPYYMEHITMDHNPRKVVTMAQGKALIDTLNGVSAHDLPICTSLKAYYMDRTVDSGYRNSVHSFEEKAMRLLYKF